METKNGRNSGRVLLKQKPVMEKEKPNQSALVNIKYQRSLRRMYRSDHIVGQAIGCLNATARDYKIVILCKVSKYSSFILFDRNVSFK